MGYEIKLTDIVMGDVIYQGECTITEQEVERLIEAYNTDLSIVSEDIDEDFTK